MRVECKYCKTNYTGLIIKQMEGKITRQDVKKIRNEENSNQNRRQRCQKR